MRVVLAAGPWQIVMVAAALNQADRHAPPQGPCQDVLVLYGVNPEAHELLRTMETVARAVRSWATIVWAMDTLSPPTYERRWDNHLHRSDLGRLLARVREKIGAAGQVDEIYVCVLRTPAEKLVVEAYPNARILIYEEGLQNYVPLRPHAWPGLDRWRNPRAALAETLGAGLTDSVPTRRVFRGWLSVSGRHRRRVDAQYLFMARDLALAEPLEQVPVRLIETDVLRLVVARCAPHFPLQADASQSKAGDGGTVLVLGQCYAMFGWVSRERETAVYAGVVSRLLDAGHAVLWKDHPRLPDSYFGEIAERCGVTGDLARFRPVEVPAVVPIEFAAEQLGLTGCVAGTSSALFYLRHLYGIETYSFAGQFADALPHDPSVMNDLVRGAIANVADLHASATPRESSRTHNPSAPGASKL